MGLFRIGLVDRPQGLDLWTVPRGSATCGALKTGGCSGLDSWSVPEDWTCGSSLVDRPLWIGHTWSLKNGEVFQIGPEMFSLVF